MITPEKKYYYFSVDPDRGNLSYREDDKRIPVRNISGHLKKVEVREEQFEDEFYKKLRLQLSDEENQMYVSFGLNTNIARAVVNTLLSVKVFKPEQEFFLSTYKKDGYIKIFMQCDGNKLGWKFGPDELDKFRDEDFLIRSIENMNAKLIRVEPQNKQETPATDDDMPF